jgi:hypothetical protein
MNAKETYAYFVGGGPFELTKKLFGPKELRPEVLVQDWRPVRCSWTPNEEVLEQCGRRHRYILVSTGSPRSPDPLYVYHYAGEL